MDTNIIIKRNYSSDEGTEGLLQTPSFSLYTLELPWRDNQSCISCIPNGKYQVKLVKSPKYGLIYNVQNVPNRSHILIHSGNYAGDTSLGYKTHVQGCILLGLAMGYLNGQRAVLNSRLAVNKFMEHMKGESFTLSIEGLDIWE